MYSDKFRRCIGFVLHEEGGFVDDPKDPGGSTKYGISMRSHRTDIGDLDHDGDIDADDVQMLTVDQAIQIYHDEYWLAVHGEELPTALALAMLDTAVNCGITRAIKLLQASCAAPVDGVFGPDTLRRATKAPMTCEILVSRREKFYRGLPTFARFGNGWAARLSRLAITVEQIRRDELRRAA